MYQTKTKRKTQWLVWGLACSLLLWSASVALSEPLGLIAHWPMDEGEGIVVNDVSGNDHHCHFQESRKERGVLPVWVEEGYYGSAVSFEGHQCFVESDMPIPMANIDFSIACWAKAATAQSGDACLISIWGPAPYDTGSNVGIFLRDTIVVNHYASAGVVGAFERTPGEWVHVTVTEKVNEADPTTVEVKIYANGVEVGSGTEKTFYKEPEGTRFFIGERYDGDKDPFDGMIDDVAIFDRVVTADEILSSIMPGIGGSTKTAYNPMPTDDATEVLRDSMLSWTPGETAVTHNVYIGTSYDDVNDATVGIPLDVNSYDPGRLEFDATYFWRVDEVNEADPNSPWRGKVWSFTVEPYARLIPGQAISVTASSQSPNAEPEKTIDRSGMDANDLHSKDPEGMWISEASEPNEAWIQYEFDKPYKLHQMLVWNYNGAFISIFGLKDVTIEYSTDGASWSQIKAVFAQAPGKDGYASNTIVEFGEVAVKFVKITANSNWTPIPELNQYGLSEVQFLQIPVSAREPSPESGTTDVAVDATLSWKAGRGAAEHDVYVSTDEQAVIEGTAPMETVIKAAYSPALDLNTTYFWRVDEVNEAEVPAVWEGSVWNLTTQPYITVDDFEGYTDAWNHIIFQTWIDGYGWDDGMGNSVPGNDTGAAVGYWPPPTIEDVNVYDGEQSMPLTYGIDAKTLSETTATLPSALAVNQHGIKTLSLQFYGNAANVPGQLFIKINGQNVSNYPGSQDDMKVSEWHAWTIDLAAAGVTSIQSMTIGITGGSGMIFIDAIRLYPTAD